MTPEHFRQIRNVFDAALEREGEARRVYLDEACLDDPQLRLEVEGLLAAHQRPNLLLDGSPEPRMEGRCIGNYEILRELAQGGMGAVYLAVRTDDLYRKQVALKIVRPEAGSQEVIHRFHQERHILAALDHPNIARLLDGGATAEGLPYFVMDYVQGLPIDGYCDRHGLGVKERLKLFADICSAVDYAHRQGVVHRDIKPGNILVNPNGTAKLLDFGIAKLLRVPGDNSTIYSTRTGMRLMTPEYASPEQVRGDQVGPASDIYSLGVLLYELLTGHRPYRMMPRLAHEVERLICEQEPARPSEVIGHTEESAASTGGKYVITPQSVSKSRENTPAGLRKELAGDLDHIVLQALDKRPAARYATAIDFRQDIERHLSGLPVTARPPSVGERIWKLFQQRKWWVAAIIVLAAAFETGAVQVDPVVAAFALGSGCVLAGLHRIFKQTFGDRFAELSAFGILVACSCAAAIVGSVVVYVRKHPLPIVVSTKQIPIVVSVSLTVVVAFLLSRWFLRERLAGAVLLNFHRPRPWPVTAFIVTAAAMMAYADFDNFRDPIGFIKFTPWALTALLNFLTFGKVEVRENGILNAFHLVKWESLRFHKWETSPEGITCLRTIKRFDWMSVWIPIPLEHKSDVLTVLERKIPKPY